MNSHRVNGWEGITLAFINSTVEISFMNLWVANTYRMSEWEVWLSISHFRSKSIIWGLSSIPNILKENVLGNICPLKSIFIEGLQDPALYVKPWKRCDEVKYMFFVARRLPELQMWMWIRIGSKYSKNTMVSWQARDQPQLPGFWKILFTAGSKHVSPCLHLLHSGTLNKMKSILYSFQSLHSMLKLGQSLIKFFLHHRVMEVCATNIFPTTTNVT